MTGRRTVRQHISRSNALMVSVVLAFFLAINLVVVGIYFEAIEGELKHAIEGLEDEEQLERMIVQFTMQRESLLLLFFADALICVTVLMFISRLFMGRLSARIMEPLEALTEGAERIRQGELTQEILYAGDAEFENVCGAFNDMQRHILREREKNRRYEKARTDMIAGISHDLRTPLTAVRGAIKGLLDGVADTPEQQRRFLETAFRRTGDMDVLLRQLFYLSRLETGNMPLSLQMTEISALIGGYVKDRRAMFAENAVEITARTGEIRVELFIDPGQLRRIFDNLLENSRKYAEVHPLKIEIALTRINRGVCLRFSDNGRGVPEEKLPYVFEEFYRGDESRGQKDGNGLGLYIVKYLTEAMGGSVRAENREGFSVYIELPTACAKRLKMTARVRKFWKPCGEPGTV